MVVVATQYDAHDHDPGAASTTSLSQTDAAFLTGRDAARRRADWTRTAVANQRIRQVHAAVATKRKVAAARVAAKAAAHAADVEAAASREQRRRAAARRAERDRAARVAHARASRS
ncbi:MAG: hypothetical protein JWO60_610, partial [Frankiales bacterium]|nr:hypothetical protein [Frankiales bacterium]